MNTNYIGIMFYFAIILRATCLSQFPRKKVSESFMVICRFKMYFAAILPEQQVKMLFLKDSVIISYLLLMNTLLISVTCYQMCGPAHGRMLESMNLHLVSVLVIGLIY